MNGIRLLRVRSVLLRFSLGVVATGGLLVGCATVAPTTSVTTSVTAPDSAQESAPVTSVSTEPMSSPAVSQPESEVPLPTQVSLQEFVEHNDDRLLQAYVGMSRQGVDRLMGGQRAGIYNNPFRQQSISLGDGKRYDVLYFLTRAPRAGQAVTETMLTPVILRNDKIVAIGRYPLKKLRRGECPASKPSTCQ